MCGRSGGTREVRQRPERRKLGKAGGGGGGDWEWPGSEGEGSPRSAWIPSGGVDEGGSEGAGDSPEKGGPPREQRCGSSGWASVGRTAGDLEQPGEGRERPAPPPLVCDGRYWTGTGCEDPRESRVLGGKNHQQNLEGVARV